MLVDAGTDVGLPFAGQAPDIGAYEVGLMNVVGAHRLREVGVLNPFRDVSAFF
jgi:hypothetical protein